MVVVVMMMAMLVKREGEKAIPGPADTTVPWKLGSKDPAES